MAFCPKCGKDIGESKFCPSCGSPAQAVPQAAQPQPPSQAPPAGTVPPLTPPGPPAAPGTPPPGFRAAAKAKQSSTGAMVCGAGGVVLMILGAIGSALPWATVSFMGYSQSKNGLSGDGVITIITCLLALAFFAVGALGKAKWPFIVALVLTLVSAGVSVYDAADLTEMISIGIGLWMVMIASIVGLLAAIGGIVSPRTPA